MIKFKRGLEWVVVLALLLCAAGCSDSDDDKAAASKGSAQVRVACMLFTLADVSLDGQAFLDDMVFPFISTYTAVPAGQHDLRVVSAEGETDTAAQIELSLDDGHSYLVVSYGNRADQTGHTLMVIDETDTLAQISPDHNMILFLHLVSGAPGLDGYIQGEKVMENITFGQRQVYAMPIGDDIKTMITPANLENLPLYEEESNSPPNAYTVVAAVGTLLDPTIAMDIYSTMNLADVFAQVAKGGYYDSWSQMLQESGLDQELSGPGPLTVFAPWDAGFLKVPLDALMADPARLKDVIRYNLVAESLPPYELTHRSEITTLQGSPLTVTHVDSNPWFLLNGSAKVYQAYHTSNGTFYEVNQLLMPPSAP